MPKHLWNISMKTENLWNIPLSMFSNWLIDCLFLSNPTLRDHMKCYYHFLGSVLRLHNRENEMLITIEYLT
jgi:hypothetical protein